MHVSTAFNNLDKEVVDEIIYPGKMDPIQLTEFIDNADDSLIDRISQE